MDGKGKEEQWNKHIDNNGNTMNLDILHDTSTYEKHIINGEQRNLTVANYKNPDIYKDFS
ncbi:MAG: hypothetical protein WCP92_02785 [bacterium]